MRRAGTGDLPDVWRIPVAVGDSPDAVWQIRCPRPSLAEAIRRIRTYTALRERWSSGTLEHQLQAAASEGTVLGRAKVSPLVAQMHPEALNAFKDSYVDEFLDLLEAHSDHDLHRGLLQRLRDFLTELGRDFCFVGSEVPIQVGNRDFALELLFFHRGLNCLCAIELKVGRFEPKHLGKLNFYLEALDRDVR